MADHKYSLTFAQPAYKDQTASPSNVGVLIAPGDTLTILKKSADGTNPEQAITVSDVLDAGRTVLFEYDSGNVFLHPGDEWAVHPDHQFFCPEFINVGATEDDGDPAAPDDTAVTNFKIGANSYSGTWPITANGAAALQLAMQEAIDALGIVDPVKGFNSTAVTVNWIDASTDYLQIYIMNTNQVWKVTDSDGEVTLSPDGLP